MRRSTIAAALMRCRGGRIGPRSPNGILWQNPGNVNTTPSSQTKSAGGAGWNAGASSVQTVAAGQGVAFVPEGNTCLGLSSSDPNYLNTAIEFRVQIAGAGNLFYVYEGATYRTVVAYTPGTQCRVVNDAGTIKFYNGAALVYTSLLTPAASLLIDTSIYAEGQSISEIEIVPV